MPPLALSTTRPSAVTNRSLYCRQPSARSVAGAGAPDADTLLNAASNARTTTITLILPSSLRLRGEPSSDRNDHVGKAEPLAPDAGTGPKTACVRSPREA